MYMRNKIPGDDQHNKVVDTLNDLDALMPKVLWGLVIFWTLWLIGVVITLWYYIAS
jgi:hypothetical protein